LKGTYLRDFDLVHAESQRAQSEGGNIINLIINDEEPPQIKPANNKFQKSNSNQKLRTKESKENLIVDSNVIDQNRIAEAVGDLIKKVNSSIDPNKIKAICKSQYGIEKIDKIDYDGGDIIAQNDQLTFQLDYKVSHKLTLFIDRQGNIKVSLP
jgi:hypothetical protein